MSWRNYSATKHKNPGDMLLHYDNSFVTILSALCYFEWVPFIIIIWHYNPLWVFAFPTKSVQVLLSLAVSFQFFTFSFFRSSTTSSCHRCLGLLPGIVPIGFQSNSFLVGHAWSIRWICPSHLTLCPSMNLTISAPSINLSISMLLRILHILSVLTGPNIFLSICLSKMRSLSSPFDLCHYTSQIFHCRIHYLSLACYTRPLPLH
jgi:hypothetical protein